MEEILKHLKPFNLEEAKAGKPICTRDGRKARIICYDKKGDSDPIIALIENHFKDEPAETRFDLCRKLGVVYYYRKNENKSVGENVNLILSFSQTMLLAPGVVCSITQPAYFSCPLATTKDIIRHIHTNILFIGFPFSFCNQQSFYQTFLWQQPQILHLAGLPIQVHQRFLAA